MLAENNERSALVGIEAPVFKGNVSEKEPRHHSIKLLLHIKDNQFTEKASLKPELDKAMAGLDHHLFTILLSHRPEKMALYKEYPIDLVLSGHAHGGQIRLPFIGGVLSSGQGLFPKYQSGIYEEDETKMIVSRGLGSGKLAFRINDNAEVIVITLNKEEGMNNET